MTNNIADWRAQRAGVDGLSALPDVLFDVLPRLSWAATVPDACTRFLWLVTTVSIFVKDERRTLAFTFLDMQAMLFVLRSTVVTLTTLPAPNAPCRRELPSDWLGFALEPVWRTLTSDGMISWCHDLMFSGHASHMLLMALFIHVTVDRWYVRTMAYILCASGIVALIVARIHYSVDVAVSIGATAAVFSQSHQHLHAVVAAHKVGLPTHII